MRNTYHQLLKEHFRAHLLRTRAALDLTQAEMAARLEMDERSYCKLEYRQSCCSAVTLALYLLRVCEDVPAFLEQLRRAFTAAENDQAA